jgi:hypothetical protein
MGSRGERGEEEEEFFNHYKNDLKRHAHTPSGDAGAREDDEDENF